MLIPTSSSPSIINAVLCINSSQSQRCRVHPFLLHIPASVFYLEIVCNPKVHSTKVQEPPGNALLECFPIQLLLGISFSLHREEFWALGKSQEGLGQGNFPQERGDPVPLAQRFLPPNIPLDPVQAPSSRGCSECTSDLQTAQAGRREKSLPVDLGRGCCLSAQGLCSSLHLAEVQGSLLPTALPSRPGFSQDRFSVWDVFSRWKC